MSEIKTPRMAIEEVLMFNCKLEKSNAFDIAVSIESALAPFLLGDNNRTTQGFVLRDRLDAMAVRLDEVNQMHNLCLRTFNDVTKNLMERVKKLEKLLDPLSAERKCAEMKTSGRFRIEVMKNKSSHWKQWDSYPEFEHSRQWADSFFQNPANELVAVRVVTATKDGPDELVYLKRKVE